MIRTLALMNDNKLVKHIQLDQIHDPLFSTIGLTLTALLKKKRCCFNHPFTFIR